MTIANKFARRLCKLLAACGLMLGTAQAQTVIYYHTDALGSPVATTNAAGVVIERTEYEPYGQVLNPPVKDGPGYAGHVSDAQTGLSYMQQRYYDPQIGRFLSLDPVTADANTGGNFNRYWYANNNPYKFIDPDGRQSMTEMATADASYRTTADPAEQARQNALNHITAIISILTGTDADSAAPPGSGQADSIVTSIEFAGAAALSRGGAAIIGARSSTAAISTPHGSAVQSATPAAQAALSEVQSGTTVYRAGQFGVQQTAEGQFWSLQNPTTTAGYAGQMGMPGAPRIDWVMAGRVRAGAPVVTRPAPAIGSNSGGAMEAVVAPGGVKVDWFHTVK